MSESTESFVKKATVRSSNGDGVIRIGRKGLKKFAFGEDGEPFEVDVVSVMRDWFAIDESFRQEDGEGVKKEDVGTIKTENMPAYHYAAVQFVTQLAMTQSGTTPIITVAEALDFIARLREQYDELVVFFRPKKPEERESPGTSQPGLRFSTEEDA